MTKTFTTAQIRQAFIDYFVERGHRAVHSASLVPGNDPTLLFTNAGMVPFKDIFTGLEQRDYRRAVSAQRCVRAGGKHNDLENVGYTARHHTFFEMMGNFSFGDYFKEDAIRYAWGLVTEVYGLPKEKLWVTVYHEDDEAWHIWHDQIGVPEARIVRIGDKPGKGKYESDNFWSMGDTGPCGPCSEIFYDHGAEVWGGPPGSPEEDGDRYIEIWNLVFMQFERDEHGVMKPLPRPSIDTGMGLERMAAVLQGVHSNYDIDIFKNLIRAAATATGCADLSDNSLKVIADHIRATVFLMVDGVLPGKEGRDYVLRRIMRRAIRHGYKLGKNEPFFYQLVDAVVAEMGGAYPEIVSAQSRIRQAVLREEERFAKTLDEGMGVLEKALSELEGDTIDGATVFKLYDTYGFPVDLTADIARERALKIDFEGYEAAMSEQRQAAKAAGKFKAGQKLAIEGKSHFEGYKHESCATRVEQLFVDGEKRDTIDEGTRAVVVLERTPFFGECGGQVGDTGTLCTQAGTFVVEDTQKQGDALLHFGLMHSGTLAVGDDVLAQIDSTRRAAIRRHHSATHLLHKALRETLGEHVQQKGSWLDEHRTRFDFLHDKMLSPEEIAEVEDRMNAQVLSNAPVIVEQMRYEDARAKGAMALFGEKYADVVRVVSMGDKDYSVELCGGTHVARLGEIGLCKVSSQGAVSAGVRRIEVVCGLAALDFVRQQEAVLHEAAATVKTDVARLAERLEQLLQHNKALEKERGELKKQLAQAAPAARLSPQKVKDWQFLAVQRDGLDNATLRDSADQLRDQYQLDLVVLGSADGDTARLVVSVAKSAQGLHAGKIIQTLAQYIDGKGGGRPDFAQAGGKNPAGLPEALAAVPQCLEAL